MRITVNEQQATRLGSYEILRLLARGGMAEIYLARRLGLFGFEKLVVLKKMLPHLAENAKFVQLFLDEAKLVAGLDHPHIAHVHDIGIVDCAYFLTMEYVHGQDVRSILRRGAAARSHMPIENAIHVACDIAAALHYAHERRGPDGQLLGIVHRDISPSNVQVSYDGVVKLLDFGVAKAATSSIKTRTGTLKGKVSYMSPEQARGAPLDRRSDIYSLGIVLWEMVTCSRLYRADNDLATVQKILNEPPPPPSSIRGDCPPELDAIVMRALASRADDRYASAQQLQLELEELAYERRLSRSSVALGTFMHGLFGAEIRAWHDARDVGVTLTDHVAASASSEQTPSDEASWPVDLGDDPDSDDYDAEQVGALTRALAELSSATPPAGDVARPKPDRAIAQRDSVCEAALVTSGAPVVVDGARRVRRVLWLAGPGVIALIVVTVIGINGSRSSAQGSEVRSEESRPAVMVLEPATLEVESHVGPTPGDTSQPMPARRSRVTKRKPDEPRAHARQAGGLASKPVARAKDAIPKDTPYTKDSPFMPVRPPAASAASAGAPKPTETKRFDPNDPFPPE